MTPLQPGIAAKTRHASAPPPAAAFRRVKTRPKLAGCGLLTAMALVLAGCTQGTTANNGNRETYTAARHSALGSHIPQPDSANTASATAPTGIQAEQTEQLSQAGNAVNQSSGGGGGR